MHGEIVGFQLRDSVAASLHVRRRLAGQSRDEVHVDRIKPDLPRKLECMHNILPRVAPAHAAQGFVVHRLRIDRDSAIISNLFSEENEAAKEMVSEVIRKAKKSGVKIGLCGQAPSDLPSYASFLVKQGINSISFNPDALLKGIENINRAEASLLVKTI